MALSPVYLSPTYVLSGSAMEQQFAEVPLHWCGMCTQPVGFVWVGARVRAPRGTTFVALWRCPRCGNEAEASVTYG